MQLSTTGHLSKCTATMKKIHLIFIVFWIAVQTFAQQPGLPFIRNYLQDEYHGSQQAWGIAEDNRGIIYFANSDGLLEYDGADWRLNSGPGLRSLAIDSTGIIYAGLENDLGYFKADRKGKYQFHTLRTLAPHDFQDISAVMRTYIENNEVIFNTYNYLYFYRDGKISVLSPVNRFHVLFKVRNRYFIRDTGKGLFSLENDQLKFVEGSEMFANELIRVMLPFGENEILMVTVNQGGFIFSPDKPVKFSKPAGFKELDQFFKKNMAYSGTVLANGNYAIGTATGGLLVCDARGNIIYHYNMDNGLCDNGIYALHEDRNRQLWVSTDNGTSMISVGSPFRTFNEKNGLKGTPMCLRYFHGQLYAGTSQYLHVLSQDGLFKSVAPAVTGGQNFDLYEAQGKLLLAHNPGLFEIDNDNAIPVPGTSGIVFLTLAPFMNHPEYLFAGAEDGIYVLEYRNSAWYIRNKIQGYYLSSYVIAQDSNGNLWCFDYTSLRKLKLNSNADSVISKVRYTEAQGLPAATGILNSPCLLKSGEVVFATGRGIYRYLEDKDCFEPHPAFGMVKDKVASFTQIPNGDVWIEETISDWTFGRTLLRFNNGKYVPFRTPFYKFSQQRGTETNSPACLAPDSSMYIAISSGILHYNPVIRQDTLHSFHTLIRQVNSRDSLLFSGETSGRENFENIEGKKLPYKEHDIVFHFAAVFYENSEKNLFSYRLIGSDTTWSSWSAEHKKEYTNLPEGKYIFEVRSKNQYQEKGTTASYSFRILPPWHRTWWAYCLYVLTAAIIIWIIVILNIKRLVAQKKNLEQIVEERTATVVQQKELIETAHNEITASITYAKYIQSSVLPKDEELKEYLGDYFVMHKPVEIVSGDFYWISSVAEKVIIAAADCTGHGVPGAFMSMLGISLLNEIVNKENITEPGIILDHLRDEVTSSLRQKGSRYEQKDGMDISICTIDRMNMKLWFAGANNPLYIVRRQNTANIGTIQAETEGDLSFTEIRGDAMPIGISDEMQSFSSHGFDILEGDRFYLFTDGFADQFGGLNHKRFNYKRFRELLIRTSAGKMTGQKSGLENELGRWMGSENQTDDILVIGFCI
jgi:serine phosphatase RsbU (regulator of sigma subunit)/ligand-binding sensor domain-containing protein